VVAQQACTRLFSKHPVSPAPPFGSNQGSQWISKFEAEDTHRGSQQDVEWVNSKLVNFALDLANDKSWDPVSAEPDVQVWRKYLSPDAKIAGKRVDQAAKFACVKAQAVIDAPLESVYELFLDNKRVHEYNEYCKDVRDLEWLDDTTKVTHSMTGRPWSRDFVTRVHYRELGEDSRIVVNRAEEHALAGRMAGYTRMEMALGANIMKRVPGSPEKTEFTLITHVNPGGFASTPFGAMVTNRLSTESPKMFFSKLSKAASKGNSDREGKGPFQPLRTIRGSVGGFVGAVGALVAMKVLGIDNDEGHGDDMFTPVASAT